MKMSMSRILSSFNLIVYLSKKRMQYYLIEPKNTFYISDYAVKVMRHHLSSAVLAVHMNF